jgi:RNA polymerase sigma factor (sigma-70 family)
MTNGSAGRLIQRLHGTTLAHAHEMTDADLLESFVTRQDEAAFEALVLRHGPMVLGVCRRILGDSHDAEDAFQATFLVLVRRAVSIVPQEMVANWLYGVAFRTASKARAMNIKRRAKEAQVLERPVADAHEELFWRDLLPVLDRELLNLPDKYRAPIVLCDLEGKARKEAARQLGWPEGTVSSRLAVGRKMLARRLTRRGVSLSAAALPLCLCRSAEAVPLSLLADTVKAGLLTAATKATTVMGVSTAVVKLADGVVKAMLLTKLKVATAVVLVAGLVGIGTGLVAERAAREPFAPSGETAFTRAVPVPEALVPEPGAAPPAPLPAENTGLAQQLPPAAPSEPAAAASAKGSLHNSEAVHLSYRSSSAPNGPPMAEVVLTLRAVRTESWTVRIAGAALSPGTIDLLQQLGIRSAEVKLALEQALQRGEVRGEAGHVSAQLGAAPPLLPQGILVLSCACGKPTHVLLHKEAQAGQTGGRWKMTVIPVQCEGVTEDGNAIGISGKVIQIDIRSSCGKGAIAIQSRTMYGQKRQMRPWLAGQLLL